MDKYCDMCSYRKKLKGTTVFVCTALDEVLKGDPPIRHDKCPLEKQEVAKETTIKVKRDK